MHETHPMRRLHMRPSTESQPNLFPKFCWMELNFFKDNINTYLLKKYQYFLVYQILPHTNHTIKRLSPFIFFTLILEPLCSLCYQKFKVE